MPTEIRVQVVQVGPSSSEARIRHHTVRVDRPEDKGGADQGPMGGELFLAAVGGCFMSNMLAAIKARGADVSRVQVDVIGTLAEEGPVRYAAVELRVSAVAADKDLLDKLATVADRGCIMTNTLRASAMLDVSVVGRD